jgi:hypothetical protein
MITKSNASNAAIANVERVNGRSTMYATSMRGPVTGAGAGNTNLDEVGDSRVTADKLRSLRCAPIEIARYYVILL